MNVHDFEELIISLDEINRGFIVKDFIGFLNWDSPVGALLLPYTGHHSAFCQLVKRNPQTYKHCLGCSNVSNWLCSRKQTPFIGTCYLGLSEYTIPLLIDNNCIGSIAIGAYCDNPADACRRIVLLAQTYNMDESLLLSSFETCSNNRPTANSEAVFRFFAQYLATYFKGLHCNAVSPEGKDSIFTSVIEQILHYIFLHYTNPGINVEEIALACGYSPSTISHVFKRQMKTNIRTYINRLRIVLAKKELRGGNSVALTAMECGFNDSNYFSTVFTSIVGIPPSQYARQRAQTITSAK